MRMVLFLSFLAFPAFAQDGIRATDTVLTADQLTQLLSGQTIEFHDDSKSHYRADGSYFYTYTDDGPHWTGTYQVFDESRVCVEFDNGSTRCDQFIRDGERIVLVIADGTRFPIRNRSVFKD